MSWLLSLVRIMPLQRVRLRKDTSVGRDQRGSVQKRRGGDEAIGRIGMEIEKGGRGNANRARP